MGEPARPGVDRPADTRHHPDGVLPQGREGRRRAEERRVREDREREGPGEGPDDAVALAAARSRSLHPSPACGEGREGAPLAPVRVASPSLSLPRTRGRGRWSSLSDGRTLVRTTRLWFGALVAAMLAATP